MYPNASITSKQQRGLTTAVQYSQHGNKDVILFKSLMNFGKLTVNTVFFVKSFGLIAMVQCVAGKIGPPKLNISRHGDEIMVDIHDPVFSLSCIEDVYSYLTYSVTVRNSKNEVGSRNKS